MAALILPSRFTQQPQQAVQVDPSIGADFAWLASVGRLVGPAVGEGTASTDATAAGIRIKSGYRVVNGQIPSMHMTTWTEIGVVLLDGVGELAALGARTTGQMVRLLVGSVELTIWGVADVSITGPVPTGIVRYAISRNGANHTVWFNGKLFGTASVAGTPVAYDGTLPAIGARAGSGASLGEIPLTATNGVLAVARTPRVLPDTLCRQLSENPWQLFKAPARRIWVSAGAPAGATYNVSIAETASAVDALSAILAGLASIAETGAASDASSAALIGTAAVAESGTAADSQAASAVFVATRSDALAAADTTSTGGAVTSAAVAETAVATDSTSAIAAFLASVAESGTALDSQNATAVLNAAWSDALNATDTQNWGGSVISVSLSEALNALDSQSASTVFAASVSESSAALDATSCVLIANASISEVLAALDSTSVQLITSASIAEALSALDTTSIVNLNFIAAASHILVGRARVTVLVGKERILVIY